jgi:hypothetical protein
MVTEMIKRAPARWLWLTALTILARAGVNAAVPDAAELSRMLPTNIITLPFELVGGRVLVPARVNGSDAMSVMLDTGYSIDMLSGQIAEKLGLKRNGQITIRGIAGEEKAALFEGATFGLSGAKYSPRRVAALSAGYQRRWRKRDGILGAGFFRRFVVEIDFRARKFSLHEPESFRSTGLGEVIPLTFNDSTPVVEGAILLPDRAPILGRFELDTGCDGGLCLGSDFVESNHLLEATGETKDAQRTGVGGDTSTRTGHVPKFRLGSLVIEKPLANFFLEGSPVDTGYAGHIGMDVFRRFKVIFDYSRQRMILETAE